MYKYEETHVPRTMRDMLKLYNQEDIFKIIFKKYPDVNITYLSPFRIDHNPNCFFEWYKGVLMFRDFGDVRRDCFQAVKDYFNLFTYQDTFDFIIEYFQLNGTSSKDEYVAIKQGQTNNLFYDVTTEKRSFELRDHLYWKEYYITEEQLLEDYVYPVSKYRFYSKKNNRWFIVRPNDIAYVINGFDRGKKIYRPKMTGKAKWLTNCGANDIGNVNNISTEEHYLLITKSYKDHRVIKNEGYSNTVWFQSEKMYPSDEILRELLNPFPDIYIFYDNDQAGIEGSAKLRHKIMELFPNRNPILIYSPFSYFKDPAEIVSVKGKKVLNDLLWKSFQ